MESDSASIKNPGPATAVAEPLPLVAPELVDENGADLFEFELPAADPRERRAANRYFFLAAGLIVALAFVLGIAPGFRKRASMLDCYRQLLEESAELRQERARLTLLLKRIDERDPYLIESLARDRLEMTGPLEQLLPRDKKK